MNKRKGGKTIAVIDIGSNMLTMNISQLKKGEITTVDQLEYPISLGHEVFHTGKISFESLREISKILHGFTEIMGEYDVEQYRVVATTALREAKNKDYIVDQLEIQNHMSLNILADDEEKTLIYSELLSSPSSSGNSNPNASSLVSYIGTGTIGLAVYDGTNVVFSQNIPLGSLKLRDRLTNLQGDLEDFSTMIEEYLSVVLRHVSIPNHTSIRNLILTGNDAGLIAKLCGMQAVDGRYSITSKQLSRLFASIRTTSPEKLSEKYHISERAAEMFYSTVIIYSRILDYIHVETVIFQKVDLCLALRKQMLIPRAKKEYDQHIRNNALSCAKAIARQYQCEQPHYNAICSMAAKIFDKLKNIHGLDPKQKLFLELACILHECGYYTNAKYQQVDGTFDLIKNIGLYGLTDEEMLTIAFVARYDEFHTPDQTDLEFATLPREQKLIISKLVAIFRLAAAMDKSHKQKFKNIKIRLDEDNLVVSVESDFNFRLEKWAFSLCSPLFREVFGISPVLVVKSLML